MGNKLKYLLLVILMLYTPSTEAQAESTFYLCIKPLDTSISPYLIAFRNTPQLGFIFAEDVVVTVYGSSEFTVGMYHITPDAFSGGYRRDGRIAIVDSTSGLNSEHVCVLNDVTLTDLQYTIPLPFSKDQALLIMKNDDSQEEAEVLDHKPFLGSAAIQFMSDRAQFKKSIQIIQLTKDAIDLTFPFVTDSRDPNLRVSVVFVLLANKDISVQTSYTSDEQGFSATVIANNKDFFYEQLQLEQGVNLFDVMNAGKFRFYPAKGLIQTYPSGGFIRLGMSDTPAQRQPVFVENQWVQVIQLEGFKANYYLPDRLDEPWGNLVTTSDPVIIKRIDERGQLIISVGERDVILEAWLVETTSP